MYVDEHNHYPTTWGVSPIGYNDAYGVLSMDDWKETLVPYFGLQGGSGDSLDRLTNLRKPRCPQWITKDDGARGNCQYSYNASGTAKFHSSTNLSLGGYLEGQLLPTVASRIVAPANLIAVGDVPLVGLRRCLRAFPSLKCLLVQAPLTFAPRIAHSGRAIVTTVKPMGSSRMAMWNPPGKPTGSLHQKRLAAGGTTTTSRIRIPGKGHDIGGRCPVAACMGNEWHVQCAHFCGLSHGLSRLPMSRWTR